MDKLWAPWRQKYIAQVKKKQACIFCRARRKKAADLVVFRQKYSLCMLNIFPYNNGHLMISPLRHTKELSRLSEEERLDLFASLVRAQKLLRTALKPAGFNIGINLERPAGAGITGHIHIHIVPRWVGDTNFMPVIHGTKVISQSLRELQRRLIHVDAKAD